MEISRGDMENLLKKIRREEWQETKPFTKAKPFRNKKKYSRKSKHNEERRK